MAEVLTIATNSDNDIYMDNFHNIAFSEDKKALSNVVLNAVRTNRGELQYDLSAGIPYLIRCSPIRRTSRCGKVF